MEATGYALEKVVHNSTIVREIDEVRQREMWQWACIGVVFVAVLLVTVWQQSEFLDHGYRVEAIKAERAHEDETAHHLRLEIDTLRSPQRIEGLATSKLQMVAPGQRDAVVIERVASAGPPPSSVVAAR